MKQNVVETIIGFVVLIIAGLFLLFAYNTRDSVKTNDGYLVTARFQDVDGITVGSDIKLAGVKVGYVESLKLDDNNFFAVVRLRLNKEVRLPKDSQAAVLTSGILGNRFIGIVPGGDAEHLVANDQIKYTQPSINIESIIGKLMYSIGNSKKE